MVRRAVLGTPKNSISTANLPISITSKICCRRSQKDGAGNMAVINLPNLSRTFSPPRARVRDIAQRSVARSEGSAVATTSGHASDYGHQKSPWCVKARIVGGELLTRRATRPLFDSSCRNYSSPQPRIDTAMSPQHFPFHCVRQTFAAISRTRALAWAECSGRRFVAD